MSLLFYFTLGVLAQLASFFLGVGGGIIIVPALYIFLGFDQSLSPEFIKNSAHAHSFVLISFSGAWVIWSKYKIRQLQVSKALWLCAGGLLGGPIGSQLNTIASPTTFRGVFAIVTLCIAALVAWKPAKKAGIQGGRGIENNVPAIFLIAFIISVVGGFMGIGGGAFLVGLLFPLTSWSYEECVGIALPMVFAQSVASMTANFYFKGFGVLDPILLILAGAGIFLAAMALPYYKKYTGSPIWSKVLIALLLFISLQMLVK